MKSLKLVASLLLLCIFVACNTSKKSTSSEEETTYKQELFDQNGLLDRVQELSSDTYEGRGLATKGAEKARTFIKDHFEQQDVEPFVSEFEQAFEAKLKESVTIGINVLGLVKGTLYPEKHIVVSAHYDHVGVKDGVVYNGADDNASGVSALIAFAEYFKHHQPKHSVILAAFDNEEYGLQGAKYFVEQAMQDSLKVVFNINMDMISRSDKNEIYAVGQLSQKELQPLIAGLDLPEEISIPTGHEGNDGTRNWLYASDHAPFYRSGIPVIYFGVDDHPDYHKPTDDFEKIDKEFYIKAVEVIIKSFDAIDSFYQ